MFTITKDNKLKISEPYIDVIGGKQILIEHLETFDRNLATIKITDGQSTYLEIDCECGKIYEYETKEDIPSENVVCECGNEIITYKKTKCSKTK